MRSPIRMFVTVKPSARRNRVLETSNGKYTVYIKSAPVGGEANKELIETLSRYLDIPKSHIIIVAGFKARNKILEIN